MWHVNIYCLGSLTSRNHQSIEKRNKIDYRSFFLTKMHKLQSSVKTPISCLLRSMLPGVLSVLKFKNGNPTCSVIRESHVRIFAAWALLHYQTIRSLRRERRSTIVLFFHHNALTAIWCKNVH